MTSSRLKPAKNNKKKNHSNNSQGSSRATVSSIDNEKYWKNIQPDHTHAFAPYNYNPKRLGQWHPVMGYTSMRENAREPKKTPLPHQVEWDGTYNTWKEFEDKFESHFYQTQMGYLFHPAFYERYQKYGLEAT